MEVIVKKFLAIIMLGLAANLFGMQQPTVEFPEDSIELKIQEFYTKYEFIDRTVRSINSAPAEQINQAIACIDDATKLLRTIESQLTNKCAESDEWYALAQALRVANLLPFKEIIPSCAIMVLKSQISARMFDLNTDISRCRGILEGYRVEDEYWPSNVESAYSVQPIVAEHSASVKGSDKITSTLASVGPIKDALKERLQDITTKIQIALAQGAVFMEQARQAHESERAIRRRYAQYCTEQREQASVQPVIDMNMLALIAQVKEPGKSDKQKLKLYRAIKCAIKTASAEDVKALSQFFEFNYKYFGYNLSKLEGFQLLKGMLETMVEEKIIVLTKNFEE